MGLSPWVAFSVGFSKLTGVNYGIVHVIISVIIVIIDILLREKIGWGTLGDALVIGSILSILDSLKLMPVMTGFWEGIAAMLIGTFVTAIGSFFYMDAAFGCGPRDALFVALCRLMPKLPVGAVRIMLEGSALLIGWLMGAKVGLGTVIAVFGIGVFIEIVFRFFRFDVKRVHHENLIDTHKNLMRLYRGQAPQ